jgi:hypothetical protein
MRCPSCQSESTGAYCAECGTPLKARCKRCDSALVPGARYCTECGSPVRAGASLPWYVGGVALVALIVVALLPASRQQAGGAGGELAAMPPGGEASGGAPAGGGSPPALSDDPRENADRLFNRIMQMKESGDTAGARRFTPMAIQAYGMAAPLDSDGLYHLSLIQTFAGQPADGQATAEQILAMFPNHLLGLIAGAEAADAAGKRDEARAYWRRFIAAYEEEKDKPLPEYQDHGRVFPSYLETAQRYVGS